MAVGNYVEEFASYTTMHGFSRIVASKATPKRLAWSIVFATAWIVFTVQMSYVLRSYFEYPKKLKTDIVNGGVPFPAITLCNLGSFDFYTVVRLSQGITLLEGPDDEDEADTETNEETDDEETDDEETDDEETDDEETDDEQTDDEKNDYQEPDYGEIGQETDESKLANHSLLNDTFIRAMYKYYRVLNKSTSLNETDEKIYLDKMFSRSTLAANIPTKMLSENGVQENEFIVKCTYRNKQCRFKKIFDPYFFNCYTFTAPNATQSVDDDKAPLFEGIENGLTVMLLAGTRMLKDVYNPDFSGMPGIYSKDSALSGAGGVRVVIHPPGTKPFPLSEGYDVPPNQMATLSLTTRRRKRLDHPYGHCNEKYPFMNHHQQKLAGPYRRTACEKVCIQKQIFKDCKCYESSLPTAIDLLPDLDDDVTSLNHSKQMTTRSKIAFTKLQNYCFSTRYLDGERNGFKVDPCKWIEKCSGTNEFHRCFKFYSPKLPTCDVEILLNLVKKIKCADEVKDRVMANATLLSQCSCHPSCNDVLYDVAYSLSQWPSEGIDGETVSYEIMDEDELNYTGRFYSKEKKEFYGNYTNEDFKLALKDFSKINVFVSDADVLLTTEEPAMTLTQLVSDIGGQLGVWIGVSVLTIAEVLEILILMLMECRRERSKEGKPKEVGKRLSSLATEDV